MQTFDFTIRIASFDDEGNPRMIDGDEFLDRVEGPLFEAFGGDVTPSVSGSVAYLECMVSAPRISEAVEQVTDVMSTVGLGPSHQDRLRLLTTVELPLPLEYGWPFSGGAGDSSSGEGHYYTIQSGDTLSGIAEKFLGDPSAYDKIFEANREVIGDPQKIFPGLRIRVPD